MNPVGILPSQWIRRAIVERKISHVTPDQIQPNSLDLRLGSLGWRIQCSFLPGAEGVARKLERFRWFDVIASEGEGVVLERNAVYLFELQESLALPVGTVARANPKSSTGRLDVFTRLITEHGQSFDEVPDGYTGKLYLEVVPRSFAIRVRKGDCLSQIRFSQGNAQLEDKELSGLLNGTEDVLMDARGYGLGSAEVRVANGVYLSVALCNGPVVGYRARKNTPPIDLRKIGGLAVSDYWEPVESSATRPVILEPNEFYTSASRELVRIPPQYCAEMVPFDAGSGELRTHYAGFFDSGFGYARGKPAKTTAAAVVLEVRSHDVPFLLEDGHPLFRLLFFKNTESPERLYGDFSNYQGQRLKLSKQFTPT